VASFDRAPRSHRQSSAPRLGWALTPPLAAARPRVPEHVRRLAMGPARHSNWHNQREEDGDRHFSN
jgi:hypothetical protein